MKRCPHCKARTLPFVAVLRSTDRRPLRCPACGEFAFLPSVATFPLLFLFELAVCIGVLAAFVFSGATLLVAALAFAGALGLGIAAVWPLTGLSSHSGEISLTHPSRFYSGNP